jgi:predicted  nucleic acid-binding Zn ribbon protein
MQTAAVNTNAAASGAEDARRCGACAQREWQFSVLIRKIVDFLCGVVRVFC